MTASNFRKRRRHSLYHYYNMYIVHVRLLRLTVSVQGKSDTCLVHHLYYRRIDQDVEFIHVHVHVHVYMQIQTGSVKQLLYCTGRCRLLHIYMYMYMYCFSMWSFCPDYMSYFMCHMYVEDLSFEIVLMSFDPN